MEGWEGREERGGEFGHRLLGTLSVGDLDFHIHWHSRSSIRKTVGTPVFTKPSSYTLHHSQILTSSQRLLPVPSVTHSVPRG